MSCSWSSRSASRVVVSPAAVLVAVDRLAEQRDFQAALIGQYAGFREDLLRRAALLRPARHRHDAVGAELVAADQDPNKGLGRRRAASPDRASGSNVS